MKYNICLVWVAAALAAGCSCVERKSAQELSTSNEPQSEAPVKVVDTTALATYWDGHDFTSLDAFEDIEVAEDKFDGYIELLTAVSHENAVADMTRFLDSAALNEVAYMVWATWFEAYLHTYDSPYRNDALFAVWLDKVLGDQVVDDYTLERLQQVKNVSGLNVVGKPAAEVKLLNAEGEEFYISDLKGQQTLLMLLDADCPSCLDFLSENLKEYAAEDIRLLAVLVNGSPDHIDAISSNLSDKVLSKWILSFCPGREVEKGEVYDLTQVPSRIMISSEGIIERLYY